MSKIHSKGKNYSKSETNEITRKDINLSVSKFVLINSTILVFIILGFYSFSLNLTYQWGNEDSIHYFLTLKAENIQNLQRESDRLEDDNFKIYPKYSAMPDSFKATHKEEIIEEGQLLLYQTKESDNYVLPFIYDGELAFIEHQYFYLEDEYDVAISIPQLLVLLACLTLLSGFLFYYQITRKLSQQIQGLKDWTSNLEIANSLDSSNKRFQPELNEIQMVAEKFQRAINTIREKAVRESNFLKSLSHELRTPLAITKASLEIVRKSGEPLSNKMKNKLDKIEAANQSMCEMSESLLYLWSNRSKQIESSNVDINESISSSVNKYQHLIDKSLVEIKLQLSLTTIKAPSTLVQIVLDNLVRNAFQYTEQGEILVSFKNGCLTVTNSTTPENTEAKNTTHHPHQEYGYGVGLFIVESITSQLGWELEVKRLDEQFCSRVLICSN